MSRLYVKAEGKMLREMQRWKLAPGTAPHQRMRILNVFINSIPGYIGQFYPADSEFLEKVKAKADLFRLRHANAEGMGDGSPR